MKKNVVVVFVKFLVIIFCTSAIGFKPLAQTKVSLDEGWKFHLGHAANAEKDFNYSIATVFAKSGANSPTPIDSKFKDSSWRTLNVPHDWAVELPFSNSNNSDINSHGYKPIGGL